MYFIAFQNSNEVAPQVLPALVTALLIQFNKYTNNKTYCIKRTKKRAIFERSLETGQLPKDWTTARVNPFFKEMRYRVGFTGVSAL